MFWITKKDTCQEPIFLNLLAKMQATGCSVSCVTRAGPLIGHQDSRMDEDELMNHGEDVYYDKSKIMIRILKSAFKK